MKLKEAGMHWPRFRLLAVLTTTLAPLALTMTACSSAAEKPLLQQFFTASRLRDNATLANFAAVSFHPTDDGIVESFSITSVSPEQRQALHVKELAKAHDEARSADEEFSKRKKAYQDENMEAIERVLKAERQKGKLGGQDAVVQASWTKWRDETAQSAKRVSEARSKLAAERNIAEVSMSSPGKAIDVSKYDGAMVAKDVTVDAKVKMANGESTQKTLVITVERAVLKTESGETAGRWIITRIKDMATGATKTS